MHGLVIENGLVVDGSGQPGRVADVGVTDGVITEIGDLAGQSRSRTIDAEGHIVSPGFVDVHTHMDAQIGRILDELETSGQADNTWIFFTADHGLAVGHHGLFGKQNLYDHSVRVPLVIGGPGIPKGAKNNTDVYLQDVMATALDVARVEKPDYVEFNSLLPLIEQPGNGGLDAVSGAYINVQRSIRKDNWTLLVYPKVPQVKLFNLSADPEEMNNLADAEPERVEALFAALQELQEEMGDQLQLKLANYR